MLGCDKPVVVLREDLERRLALQLVLLHNRLLVLQEPDVARRLNDGGERTGTLGTDAGGTGRPRGSGGTGTLRRIRHYSQHGTWTVQESVVSSIQEKQVAKIPTEDIKASPQLN